jgi:drug/metabolite transporter (DMT)-like permease
MDKTRIVIGVVGLILIVVGLFKINTDMTKGLMSIVAGVLLGIYTAISRGE